MSVLNMLGMIAKEMLSAFFVNYFFIFLYIMVILFMRSQYQKYSELQNNIYGKPAKSLRERTEHTILTGMIAGFAASIAAVATGITIEADVVRYLFYIMCPLLIINMRFVCIAYAAGLLAFISLVIGYPEIEIPSLIALVAVLHIAESVLIYFNRNSDFMPVFINHNDEITGAYLIRRFWMIPVVFFTYVLQNGSMAFDLLASRPLFWGKPDLEGAGYALGLDCLIAILCYSDKAIATQPEKKCTRSAVMLLAYSLILIMLAGIAVKVQWAAYAAVLFCILGHEGIHILSVYRENKGKPLYNAVRRGLRVLEVLNGSHAQRMGIERGDIILGINNYDIQTDEGVTEALREYPTFTWIRVLGWNGKEKTIEYRCFPGGYNTLGIISVPREKEVTYNTGYFEHISILQNIVNKFRGMDRTI